MRALWQAGMIRLARSEPMTGFMQNNRQACALATRYVGGNRLEDALVTAHKLAAEKIGASLFYLGEYVDREDLVQRNMDQLRQTIAALGATELPLHVSVDPTQVGGAITWDRGVTALESLASDLTQQLHQRQERLQGQGETAKAEALAKALHCLMLDMEDFTVNQKTLDLHAALHQQGLAVAVTVQAYLRKTEADLETLIAMGAKVRLVKGAFAASTDIAYSGQDAIKKNYKVLIDKMLSPAAKAAAFTPIFATHDTDLQEYAIDQASQQGWPKGSYAFEMLYGARPDVATNLAQRGEHIRLYLPFGEDWWPYAVRRIGENPKNMLLLLRGFLGR